MNPSRRDVILGLGAASLAGACGDSSRSGTATPNDSSGPPPVPAPDRPPEPSPWVAPGDHDPVAFPFGVQAGDALSDAVWVSVRTVEAGCSLVVVAQQDSGWTEVARMEGLDPTGSSVQVELTGLEPDRAHAYALYANDGSRRSIPGRFRTAQAADAPLRKLRIGATSCLGSVNPTFPSLSVAAGQALDAMLLLGDSVYADGSITQADYRTEWEALFRKEHPTALFASTSLIATWDDHEVDNNWVLGSTVSEAQYAAATAAFREAIPQRVGPSGSGIWRVIPLGPVAEVFVLDSRGERSAGKIVGDTQLAEMTAALRASTARFKLVLCSVHLTDHTQIFGPVEDQDRWQGYPEQREALIAACEATPGTFVITGDMHFSAVQHVGRPGEPGDQLVEVAAGPAGSRIVPMKPIVELSVEPAVQYLWLEDAWSVTVLTLDPGTGQVTADFYDDEGALLGGHTWAP